ncbi:MAG TPA: hypothetical protein VFR55_04255 [Dehalococcoidia bacterium]|nr:hypothetical protein [Dehalococcoidia bacterium]
MWSGATGEVDVIADTIKIMALEGDTGENKDDEFVGGVITAGAVEVTSTGYTGGFAGAGRLTLGSKTLAVDQANDRAEFDCANPAWTGISQAAAETWVGFLIIKEITNDAASPVLAHIDTATGLPLTPNGSDITLTVDAEGLMQVTD